uniref:Uncharacterized protein n=1 Tax=Polytomella parva TaxID=51329 RepID=A0A7S0YSF0_9CHLO|mmetsp:Transcript_7492/g.14733  ORF Transcript_7492/g.14733 Transcript_7492/m.14733 type:complete len:462 (+) Transcript_7492:74-1459(+)|eukprot:CAMPEP_0175039020 /NCGR_PEP_ID=MMETSP0052_2-20121109/271_1 /TAXON_ID=51329 ORGANISM="Polytomella parva, Strain SAG 63-3" /NCGR_SAMPLE_ID=MMETSP0052_2 /ASSEMBLY_ACC=CAM_ASM_000194 /LENGTH=461 /DNA_ID=CAMNT_0016300665 /DNA_START=835 /DNA_END=2220 /DNA_ORIENTATION=+
MIHNSSKVGTSASITDSVLLKHLIPPTHSDSTSSGVSNRESNKSNDSIAGKKEKNATPGMEVTKPPQHSFWLFGRQFPNPVSFIMSRAPHNHFRRRDHVKDFWSEERKRKLANVGMTSTKILAIATAVYGSLWVSLEAWRRVKVHQMRRLVCDLVPALQQLGLTFWVDFGTLRSLVATGDVYSYDNDVDLVVLDLDVEKMLNELPPLLEKHGYIVEPIGKGRPVGGGITQNWIRVYIPGKMVWADLYGGYIQGPKIRINKNKACDLDRSLVLPLSHLHCAKLRVKREDTRRTLGDAQRAVLKLVEDTRHAVLGVKGSVEKAVDSVVSTTTTTAAAAASSVGLGGTKECPGCARLESMDLETHMGHRGITPVTLPSAASLNTNIDISPAAAEASDTHRTLYGIRTVMGTEVPAPHDPAAVMEFRYGKGWAEEKYGSKGRDTEEHEKFYLKVIRGLGNIGLRI